MKELLLAFNQKPIAYYRIYRDLTGSTTAGILLSQIMYWWQSVKGKEFYKTDAEILEETGLTPSELKTAKKILKSLSFVEIKAKGIPAKTYYKIDPELLSKEIQTTTNKFGEINQTGKPESDKQESRNQTNSDSGFNDTNTENTHENTHENTANNSLSQSDDDENVFFSTNEENETPPPNSAPPPPQKITTETRLTDEEISSPFAFVLASDMMYDYLTSNEGQLEVMKSQTRFSGTDEDLKNVILKYFSDKADNNYVLRQPCARNNIGRITIYMSNFKNFEGKKPTNHGRHQASKNSNGISESRRQIVEALLD